MQSINEEASSSTKRSRKLSVWKKSAKIFFYGIIGSIVSELAVFSNRVITQEPFSFVEGVVYGIMAFILAGYFGWVNIEKHDERISAILPRSWRRMARTFRWYQFAFFGWVTWIVIRGLLLPRFIDFDFSFLDMLWVNFLYLLLFFLSVYSLTVYIPSGQYLASTRISIEKKKRIANSLTILTPALGFPLILATYLVLAFANIQVEVYWNYIIFIVIYLAIYFISIDLPYSVSAKQKQTRQLEMLERRRRAILKELPKTSKGDKEVFLEKIALENEIARIDREKQEIKSQSVHPHKLTISLASFVWAIFAALLIQLIKIFAEIA